MAFSKEVFVIRNLANRLASAPNRSAGTSKKEEENKWTT
jgi:hypothetical protein